jgi:hypothetical protein
MTKLIASLLFAFACTHWVKAEAASKFITKWTVGKTYRTKFKTDTHTIAMGQDSKSTTDVEIKAVAKAGATADTTDVEMAYEKFDVKTKVGGMDKPMGNVMSSIVGQKMTLTYGADGQVKDVKGMEKMSGGNLALGNMFNQASMKQMFTSAVLAVPTSDVKPGDSWPVKREMPNPLMKVSIEGKYTYVKDEELDGHKCAVLELEASISMDSSSLKKDDATSATLAAVGMEIKDSTMKATIYFDFDLGNARKSETETSMKMSMKNPADGTVIEMPTTTKVSTTLTED